VVWGRTVRREVTSEAGASVEYEPTGRRPRGGPKKRQTDGARQDLERLGVTDREERVEDRDYLQVGGSGGRNS